MNFNTVRSWYPPPVFPSNHAPTPVPVQYQTAPVARSAFPVQHHVVPVMENALVKVPAKNINTTRASFASKQRTRPKKVALLPSPERKEEKRAQDRNSQRNFRQRQKDIMAWQEAKIAELQEKIDISEQREYKHVEIIEQQRQIIWQQNQIIHQQDTKLDKQDSRLRTLEQAISIPRTPQGLGSTSSESATPLSYPTIPCEYTPAARHRSATVSQISIHEMVTSAPYADMGSTRTMAYPTRSEVGESPAVKQEPVSKDFSGDTTADSDGSDATAFQDGFWEHEWARYGYGQDSMSSTTES